MLRFVDTHCHLDRESFGDEVEAVLDRAREKGVAKMAVVGTDLATSRESVELCERYADRGLFAVIGVHPHDSGPVADGLPAELLELASHPRVVAIGETGLDYYYEYTDRKRQLEAFARHVEWARKADKPLVVHVRDAYPEAWGLLSTEEVGGRAGVIHCFSGTVEDVRKFLDLGFYISFAGPLTYRKNDELREVAAFVPLDRLLCETDSPYLSPVPKRGKRNEPAHVCYTFEELARVRSMELEGLCAAIWENAERLFRWKEKTDV